MGTTGWDGDPEMSSHLDCMHHGSIYDRADGDDGASMLVRD